MPDITGLDGNPIKIYQGEEEPISPASFIQLIDKARRECSDRSVKGTGTYLDNLCPKINGKLRSQLQLDLINPGNPSTSKEVAEKAFHYAKLGGLLEAERTEEAKTKEDKLEGEIDNIKSSTTTKKITVSKT